MKFEILRDLTNKVFTTTIKRKFVQDDPDDINEAIFENDFGNVEIQAGTIDGDTIFKGYISKNLEEKLIVTLDPGTDMLKFSIPSNSVILNKDSSISYKCDGKLEAEIKLTDTTIVSAVKVAELKCALFELVIEDRIIKAVKDWKENKTDFEKDSPHRVFNVDLVTIKWLEMIINEAKSNKID